MTSTDGDPLVGVILFRYGPPALANQPSHESSDGVRQRLFYRLHGEPLRSIRSWNGERHGRGLLRVVRPKRSKRNVSSLESLRISVHLGGKRLVHNALDGRQRAEAGGEFNQ